MMSFSVTITKDGRHWVPPVMLEGEPTQNSQSSPGGCSKLLYIYIYIIRLFGIESEAPGPQVDEVPSGTLGSLKHDR